ncbi:MAG: deoxyribose-phosphate aldolase [Chloroflexi bacterium]|nr:deoxyribose-phosphate aldolase [Chloroflexota bacterium]
MSRIVDEIRQLLLPDVRPLAPAYRLPKTPPQGAEIGHIIDHTLLKPEATPQQIETLCQEARIHKFASVCVNPTYVPLAARMLPNSVVAVCTVIGFPLGATLSPVKAYEAQQAIALGASEVDMVLNIGALRAGDYETVFNDIAVVAEVAHGEDAVCKVILETALLTNEQKVAACQIAKLAGADFVKTSTGFGGGGATTTDIALMREVVGAEMGVKASGGVRTYEDAHAMVAAGATRIGASAGVAIVEQARGEASQPSSDSGY